MAPALLSPPAPLSPAASAIPRIDSALRLSLHPVPNREAVVDGAWWPYSRDAAAELPGLIAAVDQLLDRVTLRISVHGDVWQRIPRRIQARGRRVRIGWLRHTDPRVITLSFVAGEPVVLLIIPPGTAARTAEATLKLTAQDTAGLACDDILTLVNLPADPTVRRAFRAATPGSSASRDSERGPVIGREAPSSTNGPAPA